MQNSQPSRSVDRDLLNDLEAMTAQLPDDSSFNRRLRCLITELRALKSALPIQVPVVTWPYLGVDVFPASSAIEVPTSFGNRGLGNDGIDKVV